MIETRCLNNVVIFIQTILSFAMSRKTSNFTFHYVDKLNHHWNTISVNIGETYAESPQWLSNRKSYC